MQKWLKQIGRSQWVLQLCFLQLFHISSFSIIKFDSKFKKPYDFFIRTVKWSACKNVPAYKNISLFFHLSSLSTPLFYSPLSLSLSILSLVFFCPFTLPLPLRDRASAARSRPGGGSSGAALGKTISAALGSGAAAATVTASGGSGEWVAAPPPSPPHRRRRQLRRRGGDRLHPPLSRPEIH